MGEPDRGPPIHLGEPFYEFNNPKFIPVTSPQSDVFKFVSPIIAKYVFYNFLSFTVN